jgi:hypothetical protein
VVVTELALVAEVDDLLDVRRGQLLDVSVHRVHVEPVEHHLERGTEGQAAAAARADVVDPAQLGIHAVELPELRRSDIQGHLGLTVISTSRSSQPRHHLNSGSVGKPTVNMALAMLKMKRGHG